MHTLLLSPPDSLPENGIGIGVGAGPPGEGIMTMCVSSPTT